MTDEEKGTAVVDALRGVWAFRRTDGLTSGVWIFEGEDGTYWGNQGTYACHASRSLDRMRALPYIAPTTVPDWFRGNP